MPVGVADVAGAAVGEPGVVAAVGDSGVAAGKVGAAVCGCARGGNTCIHNAYANQTYLHACIRMRMGCMHVNALTTSWLE